MPFTSLISEGEVCGIYSVNQMLLILFVRFASRLINNFIGEMVAFLGTEYEIIIVISELY